jgi:uncharacterized protein YegP (UPF0339 family)
MTGKFVIKQTNTGTKFDLKAANGEVIASSEVYSSEAACRNGIESVRVNAPKAFVEDQTKEGFATEKNPKFELYKDKSGGYRFRLKARNGQVIATGESYKTKAACENGINSVRRHAAEAESVRETE